MKQDKVDFDGYSNSYDDLMKEQHAKFGDIGYYSEQKAKITKECVSNNIQNILEFGCGIGRNLQYLQKSFPNAKIYGSDISGESLSIAKKSNPNMFFLQDNELDDYKEKFDLIFIAGVYHHIEPKLRKEVTKRIYNLLSPEASLICFEHNPYNPLTRHMVNTCEFDEDAVLISKNELKNIFEFSGLKNIKGNYILFVPPKLEKLNFIEKYLAWLPLGGQYFVLLEKMK